MGKILEFFKKIFQKREESHEPVELQFETDVFQVVPEDVSAASVELEDAPERHVGNLSGTARPTSYWKL